MGKHKDISRINQPENYTVGWYVRVRYKGKCHSRYFSDKKHQGENLSLLAAISWRDGRRSRLGKPNSSKQIVLVASNNTGIVGVRLNTNMNRYDVSWVTSNGKAGKTSVSTRRHGAKQALKMACDIRTQKNNERFV